jgi:arsenate reductase-like glutaredoxin family protein
MVGDGHYTSPEIQEILQDLNVQWTELCDKAKDKGSKLQQAAAQETLNKALADAQVSHSRRTRHSLTALMLYLLT